MEHRTAGIVRASLIRQLPNETALHARLATVHSVAGIRRQVARQRDRLCAEAADRSAPDTARAEAARRADSLQALIEAIIDLLLDNAPNTDTRVDTAVGPADIHGGGGRVH